jgi:hypothetical protein
MVEAYGGPRKIVLGYTANSAFEGKATIGADGRVGQGMRLLPCNFAV